MTKRTKKSQVKTAAWRIFEETGQLPSRQSIMEEIGGGSARDVAAELAEWKEELADWVHHQRHRPDMPDTLYQAMITIWDKALEDANQVAQSALDKARAEVAEREQAAKASVTEARDALALSQLANNKLTGEKEQLEHRLSECEIARDKCAHERNELSKEAALAKQRASECEKESTRLRNEIEAQRSSYRKELVVLRKTQETENDRWLKAVDDARQEARQEAQRADNIGKRVEGLLDEIADLKQQHALALSAERESAAKWQARCESQSQEIKTLQGQLKAATRDLAECVTGSQEARAQTKAMETLMKQMERRVNEG
ncbi:DNA-binding protein [Thiolapillus sp.]|uniref:DNA-binding protein n=17 Tax=Thiolapillus sp. TaxID=2017437 RepID=UPI0025F9C0B6|nr:DNA-binding protein [Thiolapillus sp.]